MAKLTKQPSSSEDKLRGKIERASENLSKKDQFIIMKEKYELAKRSQLDYEKLMKELEIYNIELEEEPDVVDFSKMNRNIALCQSYSSRVGTIERMAVANSNNWRSLVEDMQLYILELEGEWEIKESKLLILPEIKELKNKELQRAEIINRLSEENKNLRKARSTLSRFQNRLSEAESFLKMVRSKSKDLSSASMNINRQIKALSLEISANKG